MSGSFDRNRNFQLYNQRNRNKSPNNSSFISPILKNSSYSHANLDTEISFSPKYDISKLVKENIYLKSQLSLYEKKLQDSESTHDSSQPLEVIPSESYTSTEKYHQENSTSKTLCFSEPENSDLINQFEKYIATQSDEIILLQNQRNDLIELLQQFDMAFSSQEQLIQQLRAELDSEKQNQKENQEYTTTIENKLTAKETEEQTKEELLLDLYNKILDISPDAIKNSESSIDSIPDNSIYDKIFELFVQSNRNNNENPSKRENALLSHLIDSLQFINLLICSNLNIEKVDDKVLLVAQCERMKQFIYEQAGCDEITPVANLFEHSDPDDAIQSFFNFIDKQKLLSDENCIKSDSDNGIDNANFEIINKMQTPIREIYTLYCATAHVNHLLFAHFDRLNQNPTDSKAIINSIPYVRKIIEENEQLHKYQEDIESKIGEMANHLSKCHIDSGNDQFERANQIIDKYAKSFENPKSQNQVKKSRNHKDKSSNLRKRDELTADITFNTEETDNQALIEKLKKKIISMKKSFEEYKHQSINRIEELTNSLQSNSTLIKNLKKTKAKLNEKNKELANELDQAKQCNQKLLNQIDAMQKKEIEQTMQFDKLIEIAPNHQIKVDIAIEPVDDFTSFEHEQCIHLQNRVDQLEREFKSKQEDINQLKEKSETILKDKNDLIAQVAKYKAINQTLEVKNKQLVDFIQYQDMSSTQHLKVQDLYKTSEHDLEIKNLQEQIQHHDVLLKSLLENCFKLTPLKKGMNYNEMFTKLEETLMKTNLFFSQETLNDANEIRRMQNLKITDSILDEFKLLKHDLNETKSNLHQKVAENNLLTKQNSQMMTESKKMSILKSKICDWEKWATQLFMIISDDNTQRNTISASELRYSINEAMLTTISHKTIIRKLNILRVEKRLLYKYYDDIASRCVDDQRIDDLSIKSLIFLILFARKLQKVANCIPLNLPFKPNC